MPPFGVHVFYNSDVMNQGRGYRGGRNGRGTSGLTTGAHLEASAPTNIFATHQQQPKQADNSFEQRGRGYRSRPSHGYQPHFRSPNPDQPSRGGSSGIARSGQHTASNTPRGTNSIRTTERNLSNQGKRGHGGYGGAPTPTRHHRNQTWKRTPAVSADTPGNLEEVSSDFEIGYSDMDENMLVSDSPSQERQKGKNFSKRQQLVYEPMDQLDSETPISEFIVKPIDTPKITGTTNTRYVNQSANKQLTNDRIARFDTSASQQTYDQLKAARARERSDAENRGLVAKGPVRLEDAIQLKGTCQTMCPIFEMTEREIQKNLDRHELGPDGQLDPSRAVKAYKRPDAGAEAPLPSDLRPGPVLRMTLDYLVNDIIGNDPTLEESNGFVWNRTRSIRQDFSQQGICDPEAVEAHERIARYHILALHQLGKKPNYSAQQEREQLGKTLKSLMDFYGDLRNVNVDCPNEGEFCAYFLLFDLGSQDFLRHLQALPLRVFQDPLLQRAIELHSLGQRNNEIKETGSRRHKAPNIQAAQNFYTKFFKMVRDPGTPFLMACMLEIFFSSIRKGALKAMNRAYLQRFPGFPAEELLQILGMDSIEETLDIVEYHGLRIEEIDQKIYVKFGKDDETKKYLFQEPSQNLPSGMSRIVEEKRRSRSFVQIINGSAENSTNISKPGRKPTSDRTRPSSVPSFSTVPPSPSRWPPVSTIISTPKHSTILTPIVAPTPSHFAFIPSVTPQQKPEKTTVFPKFKFSTASTAPIQSQILQPTSHQQLHFVDLPKISAMHNPPFNKQIPAVQEPSRRNILQDPKINNKILHAVMESLIREEVSAQTQSLVYEVHDELTREAIEADVARQNALQQISENIVEDFLDIELARFTRLALAENLCYFRATKQFWVRWRSKHAWTVQKGMELDQFKAEIGAIGVIGIGSSKMTSRADFLGYRERIQTDDDEEPDNIAEYDLDTVLKLEEDRKKIFTPLDTDILEMLAKIFADKAIQKYGYLEEKITLRLLLSTVTRAAAYWLSQKFANGEAARHFIGQNSDVIMQLVNDAPIEPCESFESRAVIFELLPFEDEVNIKEYWTQQHLRFSQFLSSLGKISAPFSILFLYWPIRKVDSATILREMPRYINLDDLVYHNIITSYYIWIIEKEEIDERFTENVKWLASQTTVILRRKTRGISLTTFSEGFLSVYMWVITKVTEYEIPIGEEYNHIHLSTMDFLASLFSDGLVQMGMLANPQWKHTMEEEPVISKIFRECRLPLFSEFLMIGYSASNEATELSIWQKNFETYISLFPMEDSESVMLLQADILALLNGSENIIPYDKIFSRIVSYIIFLLDRRLAGIHIQFFKNDAYIETVRWYEQIASEKFREWEINMRQAISSIEVTPRKRKISETVLNGKRTKSLPLSSSRGLRESKVASLVDLMNEVRTSLHL